MTGNEAYKTALSKAMALCSKREYCRSEIREKLGTWDVQAGDIEKILSALVNEKFIDEDRYAKAYARDKFRYNKWGRIKIASMLKMKKIPVETISEALGSIDPAEYAETIAALLDSRRKSIKGRNQYEKKAKLMRYGLSKGFEGSLLHELLGE